MRIAKHATRMGYITVSIKDWHPGDPFPKFGTAVSNDNETELITTFKPIPDLVVAGFYNPVDRTCYYVYPDGIDAWYKELHRQRIRVYMFNAAFDIPTAETPEVYAMLDEDLILDVGINFQLYNIATKGDIAFDALSLKGAAKKIIGMELDKGEDKGDEAARVTFRRHVSLTDEQRDYLSGDLLSTYLIGDAHSVQPTAYLQTKADLVLATMTRNGLLVDKDVWGALRNQVIKEMTEAKEKLKTFGFPFPEDADAKDPANMYHAMLVRMGIYSDVDDTTLNKTQLRGAILELAKFYEENSMIAPTEQEACELAKRCHQQGIITEKLPAATMRQYKAFMESIDALAFDGSRSQKALYPILLAGIQLAEKGVVSLDQLSEALDEYADVLDKKPVVGPVTFLQEYVDSLLRQNPNLELEVTPKSGRVKVSKTDQWRLDDAGVKSEFLEAYMDYKHNEKLLSTYLKPEFIKEDGKIHPHFNVIVRTGRTSSGGYGSLNA